MCSGDGSQWSSCVCKGASKADAAFPDAAGASAVSYVLIDDMEGTTEPNGPIHLSISEPLLEAGHWMTWVSAGSPLNTMEPNPMTYATLPAPHETMDGVTSLHGAHLVCHVVDVYGSYTVTTRRLVLARAPAAAARCVLGTERSGVHATAALRFQAQAPACNRSYAATTRRRRASTVTTVPCFVTAIARIGLAGTSGAASRAIRPAFSASR